MGKKALSEHEQCIQVYKLLEWRYQFDEHEGYLLSQLTGLSPNRFVTADIKKLEETDELITTEIELTKIKNARLQQEKLFPIFYTKNTRALEAAHACLTYRLTKLKDLRDPAIELLKPVQKADPAQPKPIKPAVVLMRELKSLAGGFFRRLFNLGNVTIIEELQEVFTIKEVAYKKASREEVHLYTPQQALHPDQKKTEELAAKIATSPTWAFANYFKNSKEGIVNHEELIKAFKKLNIERKIRNTSYADIEEILERNNRVDGSSMVTNDVIRRAIAHLFPERTQEAKKEETVLPSQPGPDFSGIHKVSLAELQLYAAFTLLIKQHDYQHNYQDGRLKSSRSKFILHGRYKYRLLSEIRQYVQELVSPHTEYLKQAKQLAEHYRRFLDDTLQREREGDPRSAGERDRTLQLYSGIYSHLETVLTQLISTGVQAPQIPSNFQGFGDSEKACYEFITNAINSLDTYLSNPTSSLTVNEIAKLAEQDEKASKVLVRLGSTLMEGEALAKPMDSLYSHKKLWEAVKVLGLQRKLQNLPPKVLDEISANAEQQIVTKEVIKEVVRPLLSDKSPPIDDESQSGFSQKGREFEKKVRDIELGLYTACRLFEEPKYYKMWEQPIASTTNQYTPFVWQSQYKAQLTEAIAWYTQQLLDINLAALQEAKKHVNDYLITFMNKVDTMLAETLIGEAQTSVTTATERKKLERTMSKVRGVNYDDDPNKDIITYLASIILHAYQLLFGYTQREIHASYLDTIDEQKFAEYKTTIGANFARRRPDVDKILLNCYVIDKMLRDIERCYDQLSMEGEIYIKKLLKITKEEKQKAKEAAKGCPALPTEVSSPAFIRGIRKNTDVPPIDLSKVDTSSSLSDTPRPPADTPTPATSPGVRQRPAPPPSPPSIVPRPNRPSESPPTLAKTASRKSTSQLGLGGHRRSESSSTPPKRSDEQPPKSSPAKPALGAHKGILPTPVDPDITRKRSNSEGGEPPVSDIDVVVPPEEGEKESITASSAAGSTSDVPHTQPEPLITAASTTGSAGDEVPTISITPPVTGDIEVVPESKEKSAIASSAAGSTSEAMPRQDEPVATSTRLAPWGGTPAFFPPPQTTGHAVQEEQEASLTTPPAADQTPLIQSLPEETSSSGEGSASSGEEEKNKDKEQEGSSFTPK